MKRAFAFAAVLVVGVTANGCCLADCVSCLASPGTIPSAAVTAGNQRTATGLPSVAPEVRPADAKVRPIRY
jgi:hypothetical protein